MAEFISWLTDSLRVAQSVTLNEQERMHGFLMTVAAGVLLPLAVFIARYCKILPGQDWPRQLNHRFWWFSHLALSCTGALAIIGALVVIVHSRGERAEHLAHPHAWFGWLSAAMMITILLNGWKRGSTGGPGTARPGTLGPLHGIPGDHYDMTAHRRWFERTHKLLGHLLLVALVAAVISGLWQTSAPRWTLLSLAAWWVGLLLLALRWERQGRCVDGYQAAWGPSLAHPGNRLPQSAWGSRRYTEEEFQRLRWTGKHLKG